jgi:hypothetical protein
MKGFPLGRAEPNGRLINEVRAAVSKVQIGTSIESLLDHFGEPDTKQSHLTQYLPENTQKQINELGSIFFTADKPDVDETWIYLNPYRNTIRHCFGIKAGQVVRKWETKVAA